MNTKSKESAPTGTKKLKAEVHITPQKPGVIEVPKGAEELLGNFLTCAGYGDRVFKATMLPQRSRGSSARKGKVSVSTRMHTRSVLVAAQTGDNGTCMRYCIPTPKKISLNKFHEQLTLTEKLFNRNGSVAKAISKEVTKPDAQTVKELSQPSSSEEEHSEVKLENIAENEVLIGLYMQSLMRLFGEGRIPRGCTIEVLKDPKSGLQEYPKTSLRVVLGVCVKLGYLERILGGQTNYASGYLIKQKGFAFLRKLEGVQEKEVETTSTPVPPTGFDTIPVKLREKLAPYLTKINARDQYEKELADARAHVQILEKDLHALQEELQDPKIQDALALLKKFQDLAKAVEDL